MNKFYLKNRRFLLAFNNPSVEALITQRKDSQCLLFLSFTLLCMLLYLNIKPDVLQTYYLGNFRETLNICYEKKKNTTVTQSAQHFSQYRRTFTFFVKSQSSIYMVQLFGFILVKLCLVSCEGPRVKLAVILSLRLPEQSGSKLNLVVSCFCCQL